MKPLIVICGPTATGKTSLAQEIAKRINGELISADSRQVFRELDLVTNKERPDVPIWLYDIANPTEEFSVSHWARLAREAISDITHRGKQPIVVGGTGLYIKALLEPLETIDIPPDKQLREALGNKSVKELQDMTNRGNMNDSDWNNPRRLIRKIEIGNVRGKSKPGMNALIIGLRSPLKRLYARIDEGIAKRKHLGLDKEAKDLEEKYGRSFLATNEHEIARKQLTWFKKQKGIHWFDADSPTLLTNVLYLIKEDEKD